MWYRRGQEHPRKGNFGGGHVPHTLRTMDSCPPNAATITWRGRHAAMQSIATITVATTFFSTHRFGVVVKAGTACGRGIHGVNLLQSLIVS